jgi:hypothetical protein
MGTRAMISKNGNPFIATHWDGYPENLGLDLIGTYTDDEIIQVASKYNIDFASSEILERLITAKVAELMRKHNLTEEKIRAGIIRGNIVTANDYLPSEIENYDDYAEYQYDLENGKWKFRSLRGSWLDKRAESDWIDLTQEEVENFVC